MFLGIFNFVSVAPFILCLFTMSAIEKQGKIKILFLWRSLSAVFAIPFLFLPFAAEWWPQWAALLLLAAANSLRNGATAIGSTGWFPLLQDIIPLRYTGRFFAKLRISWQAASLICLIISAVILGTDPNWFRFEILFAFALVGGIVMAVPIAGMVEKPAQIETTPAISIYSRIKEFWGDESMRNYTLYVIAYMAASTAIEPFKVKLLSDRGYSYGFILAGTAMVGVGAVISLAFWGTLADKFGNRAIFGISHIGMMLSTVTWVFVGKNSTAGMVFVMLLYFSWSVFNSGNTLAQTNYMLRAVPPSRQNHLTLISLAKYLATAVTPLVASLFLGFSSNLNFTLGGIVQINGYNILFAMTALSFIIPHLLSKHLRARTDRPTVYVIHHAIRPIFDTLVYVTRPIKSLTHKHNSKG